LLDDWNVDLADLGFGRVADLHARQVAELHRLPRERKRAGDHGLRGDDGGRRRQQHGRQQHPFRHHQIERIFGRFGIAHQQCALPEIVQHQGRLHEAKPRKPDRPFAEMAYIRIERLGPRQRQEDGAKHQKSAPAVAPQKGEPVIGIERGQNGGRLHQRYDSKHGEQRKPYDRDGAEKRADARGSAALGHKQHQQNDARDRHHVFAELGRRDLEALDSRQDRDRRGDDGIAEKQRRPEQPGRHDRHAAMHAARGRLRGERHQCEHAAFAAIVGPQNVEHVFDRDDDDLSPENQREHAQNVRQRRRHRMRAGERLAHRVEGRGADIAEHHPDGADGQSQNALVGSVGAVWSAAHDRMLGPLARRDIALFCRLRARPRRTTRKTGHAEPSIQRGLRFPIPDGVECPQVRANQPLICRPSRLH
jgi:hypothetical protein